MNLFSDLPLRRRAMSLEGKRPPPKDHRKKAPTREELIAAFEELQHEMMEDKEMDDEEEQINEEDDEQDRIREGKIIDTQEQSEERSELDDPLRWHTVVFNGQHKVIDLKLLEPFLKVLTHGGNPDLFLIPWVGCCTKCRQCYHNFHAKAQKGMTTGLLSSQEIKSDVNSKMLNFIMGLPVLNVFRKFEKITI